jgi:hypothetical protein
MWSGASVAHKTQVREDLGSFLTQTQMALLDLSSPFSQTTDLKTNSLICNLSCHEKKKNIIKKW